MSNKTQKELLDTFIADDGIFFDLIKNDSSLNLGTKLLYLERAITQDCNTFVLSLDKLYQPNNLETIRALKFINDIFFNNDVKYGVYGIKKALDHYFGKLGHEVNIDDFQKSIKEIIYKHIDLLTSKDEENNDIENQKKERIDSEINIPSFLGWRTALDLPQEQLTIQKKVGVEIIPILEKCGSFSLEEKQLILDAISMQHTEAVQATNSRALNELLSALLLLDGVTNDLLCIPVNGLSQPDQPIRTERLDGLCSVFKLLNDAGILLEDSSFDPIVTELSSNASSAVELVNAGIPFKDLLQLDQPIRAELLNSASSAAKLIHDEKISFDSLSNLPVEELRLVLTDTESEEAQIILNRPKSFNI